AYAGKAEEAHARLRAAVAGHAEESGAYPFNAARACAWTFERLAQKDPMAAGPWVGRAVEFLRQASGLGLKGFTESLRSDPDLDALRKQPAFRRLFVELQADRGYTLVLKASVRFEAAQLNGLAPEAHLERCRELARRGYRPVSLSLAETEA